MLATLTPEPFDKPGWVYEEKYDGDRMLSYKEGDRVTMMSRNNIDRTARFSRIAAAIQSLTPTTLLLDGEVVVFDSKGVSRFQLLQQGKGEPAYAVFDCLYFNGKDLRREPLRVRRERVDKALDSASDRSGRSVLLRSRRLDLNGFKGYEEAKRRGYEGIVAKDLSSPYIEGRSNRWLKVKVHQEDEFVIGGFTSPSGLRRYIGALLLGAHKNGKLVYVGKVGTGFSQSALASLYKKLRPLVRKTSPFVDPPRGKGVTFVEPKLVAQISYQEWTSDRKLPQPVYLGLRSDKNARDVVLPGSER